VTTHWSKHQLTTANMVHVTASMVHVTNLTPRECHTPTSTFPAARAIGVVLRSEHRGRRRRASLEPDDMAGDDWARRDAREGGKGLHWSSRAQGRTVGGLIARSRALKRCAPTSDGAFFRSRKSGKKSEASKETRVPGDLGAISLRASSWGCGTAAAACLLRHCCAATQPVRLQTKKRRCCCVTPLLSCALPSFSHSNTEKEDPTQMSA
jgi:hypothetical protein